MDCTLKQPANNKRRNTSNLPGKFRKNAFKTLFEETKLKTDEQYSKAYRKRPNQRILDRFVKPPAPTEENETDSEIWDKETLASSMSRQYN